VAALLAHEWPGNVRELQNRVQRATLVASSTAITPQDLGLVGGAARAARASSAPPVAAAPVEPASAPASAPASPEDEAERAGIQEALVRAGGVVAKAAAELGVSRQALYRRMDRLGITLERRVRS